MLGSPRKVMRISDCVSLNRPIFFCFAFGEGERETPAEPHDSVGVFRLALRKPKDGPFPIGAFCDDSRA